MLLYLRQKSLNFKSHTHTYLVIPIITAKAKINQPNVTLSEEEDIMWLQYVPTNMPIKAIRVNRNSLGIA